MKSLKAPLLFVSLLLVFVACKEETSTNYFSVTGQITAGQSISQEELINIEIIFGLLNDTVNAQNITTKSNVEFETIIRTDVDADGYYTVLNLDYGNYILRPETGYMFVPDTFLVVNIDGVHQREYLRAVEQTPANFSWNW